MLRHALAAGARAGANSRPLVSRAPFSSAPTAILVTVDIEASRVDAFRKAMATDAAGSRLEAGCRRFDLLEVSMGYL